VRRPTVPPPSVHMVRPVRNYIIFFIFSLFFGNFFFSVKNP
jgi:hypothetical protein